MKRFIFALTMGIFCFFSNTIFAQTASTKTDTLAVNGDCGMCKKRIETACYSLKGVKLASWDDEALQLVVTYDSTKTNADKILRAVANTGYDNEKFAAPDKAYNKLHGCCKYDRERMQPAEKIE
jgi:periplasmic mercuric ion binding protein